MQTLWGLQPQSSPRFSSDGAVVSSAVSGHPALRLGPWCASVSHTLQGSIAFLAGRQHGQPTDARRPTELRLADNRSGLRLSLEIRVDVPECHQSVRVWSSRGCPTGSALCLTATVREGAEVSTLS